MARLPRSRFPKSKSDIWGPRLIQQRFLQKLLRLWPALKGSLAQVHKPCIRRNCGACARGDKHPNHLLFTVYPSETK